MSEQARVGTCELLGFFTDKRRYPDLTSSGVAVIAALLKFVNTSGKGAARYGAFPSHKTLGLVSRATEPTVRRWLKYFEKSGYLDIQKQERIGQRNATNHYDVTPAVERIIASQTSKRPILKLIDGTRCDT